MSEAYRTANPANPDMCSACHAPIFWVPSEKTGRPMPLNTISEKRVVVDTYVSHFTTCPKADTFRRK